MTKKQIYDLVIFFIVQNEKLDIWKYEFWLVLPDAKREMAELKEYLQGDLVKWDKARNDIIILWQRLTNLGTMYEDLIREWYLPKMISLWASYPNPPETIKTIDVRNKTGKAKSHPEEK